MSTMNCMVEVFLLFDSNFECTNNTPETVERTNSLQKCYYFSNHKKKDDSVIQGLLTIL